MKSYTDNPSAGLSNLSLVGVFAQMVMSLYASPLAMVPFPSDVSAMLIRMEFLLMGAGPAIVLFANELESEPIPIAAIATKGMPIPSNMTIQTMHSLFMYHPGFSSSSSSSDDDESSAPFAPFAPSALIRAWFPAFKKDGVRKTRFLRRDLSGMLDRLVGWLVDTQYYVSKY